VAEGAKDLPPRDASALTTDTTARPARHGVDAGRAGAYVLATAPSRRGEGTPLHTRGDAFLNRRSRTQSPSRSDRAGQVNQPSFASESSHCDRQAAISATEYEKSWIVDVDGDRFPCARSAGFRRALARAESEWRLVAYAAMRDRSDAGGNAVTRPTMSDGEKFQRSGAPAPVCRQGRSASSPPRGALGAHDSHALVYATTGRAAQGFLRGGGRLGLPITPGAVDPKLRQTGGAVWSPSGDAVYGGRASVWAYDPRTGQGREVAAHWPGSAWPM